MVYGLAHFGTGTQTIVLADVNCIGNEDSILDCISSEYHYCHYTESVGIGCYNKSVGIDWLHD